MRLTSAIRCTVKSIIYFHCSRLEPPKARNKLSGEMGYELGLAVDGLVDGVVDCIVDGVESHIAMINQAKDTRESEAHLTNLTPVL